MTALILPRRAQRQSRGAIEIAPYWADAVVYAHNGARIYANGVWTAFAETSAQTIKPGRFGFAVDTTGESTPGATTIVPGTTFQEWALLFVGDLRSGSIDSAFDVAPGSGAGVRVNASAGVLDFAPASLTNHGTFAGTDVQHDYGAAVASFSTARGVGRLYNEGAFIAEAAHTYALSGAPSFVVVGGRYLQANRNWRGTSYLSVVFNRPLNDAEAAALSANPWQLFRVTPRRLYFDVAAGGVTITAAAGAVAFNGVDVGIDETIATSAGAATFAGVQSALVETVAATAGTVAFAGVDVGINESISTAAGVETFTGVQATIEVAGATEVNCTAGAVAFAGVQSALIETVFTNTNAVAFQGGTAGFTITLGTVAGAVAFAGVQGTVFAPVIVDCTASRVSFTGVSASIAAGGGPRGRARGRRRHYGTLGPSVDQPEVQHTAQPLLHESERYIPLSELIREVTPVLAPPQADATAAKKALNARTLAEILKHI